MKLARKRRLATLALVGPAALAIVIFMVIPLAMMAWISIQARSYGGGVHWGELTADAWLRFIFERQLDDSLVWSFNYLSIILRSVWLSAVTTVIALLVGFPTAFFMATRPERWRTLLVFMVTLPFWTNLLVRNYAWILILRDHGTINGLLLSLGIISEPLPLLHNQFAVAVGLTYSFLPFMVLPIYASLEKIDLRLVEAAFDLYANRWQALRRVILPLAMPGIIAGCILVFVPALGSYVTPELLGGGKTLMIGNLIGHQFGSARNWPFGAALGLFLLALVLIAMTIYALRGRRAGGVT
ncbi:ABC transporter permease [Nitratireductor mangrovi]|uniref:ABC transporter permease n=1 Tax=Nitratireductor mangrovi TaxID=2599600 RepID=A0A5B8L1H6_9HYPH|nr:ABC transporter permease [Nitratireductor mangrovi]QDZ01761.1 ABC transporter permease [Nitratireductor mangrovi]